MRAETSTAKGQHAGGVFRDMLKYSEQIPLALLESRGRRRNSDSVVLSVCLSAHRSARYMVLCSVVSAAQFAEFGVIAGCSMATTVIKVHGIEAFDSVPIAPNSTLDIYIDDTGLNAVGAADQVVTSLQASSAALEVAITDMRGPRFPWTKWLVWRLPKSCLPVCTEFSDPWWAPTAKPL